MSIPVILDNQQSPSLRVRRQGRNHRVVGQAIAPSPRQAIGEQDLSPPSSRLNQFGIELYDHVLDTLTEVEVVLSLVRLFG